MTVNKFKRMLNFYIGPVFLIPFFLGLFQFRRVPVASASAVMLMASFLPNTWHWSQYLAPGFGLFWIFIMLGFGTLRNWCLAARPSGLVLARLLPCIAAISLAIPMAGLIAGKPDLPIEAFVRPCCAVFTDKTDRSRLVDALHAIPGRHLVIYRPDPNATKFSKVIVANDANIDAADIVWAHDLGKSNQRLLDYYPDRKVWLLDESKADRLIPIRLERAGTPGPSVSATRTR